MPLLQLRIRTTYQMKAIDEDSFHSKKIVIMGSLENQEKDKKESTVYIDWMSSLLLFLTCLVRLGFQFWAKAPKMRLEKTNNDNRMSGLGRIIKSFMAIMILWMNLRYVCISFTSLVKMLFISESSSVLGNLSLFYSISTILSTTADCCLVALLFTTIK